MSKTVKITIYTANTLLCNVKAVTGLLELAGWTIKDKDNKISILDKNTYDWIFYEKTYNEFVNTVFEDNLWFRAYNNELQIIEIEINNSNSFSVWPEAYIKKTKTNNIEFIDFNWYYDNLVNKFNKNGIVIERVIFDEH